MAEWAIILSRPPCPVEFHLELSSIVSGQLYNSRLPSSFLSSSAILHREGTTDCSSRLCASFLRVFHCCQHNIVESRLIREFLW